MADVTPLAPAKLIDDALNLQTDDAMTDLGHSIERDIEAGAALIEMGLRVIRTVEARSRLVIGGPNNPLRPKCNQIEADCGAILEEAAEIRGRLAGDGPEIMQHIDHGREAAAVVAKALP